MAVLITTRTPVNRRQSVAGVLAGGGAKNYCFPRFRRLMMMGLWWTSFRRYCGMGAERSLMMFQENLLRVSALAKLPDCLHHSLEEPLGVGGLREQDYKNLPYSNDNETNDEYTFILWNKT